jgi:hypothetical protein
VSRPAIPRFTRSGSKPNEPAISRIWGINGREAGYTGIKKARSVQDVLGMHQDAIQVEAHVKAFLKQSTCGRASFVAARMAEV